MAKRCQQLTSPTSPRPFSLADGNNMVMLLLIVVLVLVVGDGSGGCENGM